MLIRIKQGRSFLLALLLTVAACGGATQGLIAPEGLSDKLPAMVQAVSADERIVATANIDVVSASGHYPVRAALILQQPAYLRLELLPLIGTPDLFLAATPTEMSIFIPSRGEFYSGRPTAGNMMQFLPWSLGIEDMVMIFSGTYPPLSDGKLSYERDPEDSRLYVNMKSASGDSQDLWFTKDGKISKLIRRGKDGREIYEALYEDYQPDARLAGKITIRMADTLTSVSVTYSNVHIESSIDRSVFELPQPAGIKIIQLH